MSETPPRQGSRLGPYLLGRCLPDSELGALYEARHFETGAPALVLVPDDETAAFLSRVPRVSARRRALHPGITTLGGIALGIVLTLLWPWPTSPLADDVGGGVALHESGEFVNWTDQQEFTIGYPLPSQPLKGQLTPPCVEGGGAVVINGGCWSQLKQDVPCPRGSAEHEGKCYWPVRKAPPEPRSVEP